MPVATHVAVAIPPIREYNLFKMSAQKSTREISGLAPHSVMTEPTYKCNSKCVFCPQPGLCAALLESGLDGIRFSVEGIDPAVYEQTC